MKKPKIRLLKLCRLKRDHPCLIYQSGVIVLPHAGSIYETIGLETKGNARYYRMRIAYSATVDHKVGTEAFIPVSLFDTICEWVKVVEDNDRSTWKMSSCETPPQQ